MTVVHRSSTRERTFHHLINYVFCRDPPCVPLLLDISFTSHSSCTTFPFGEKCWKYCISVDWFIFVFWFFCLSLSHGGSVNVQSTLLEPQFRFEDEETLIPCNLSLNRTAILCHTSMYQIHVCQINPTLPLRQQLAHRYRAREHVDPTWFPRIRYGGDGHPLFQWIWFILVATKAEFETHRIGLSEVQDVLLLVRHSLFSWNTAVTGKFVFALVLIVWFSSSRIHLQKGLLQHITTCWTFGEIENSDNTKILRIRRRI